MAGNYSDFPDPGGLFQGGSAEVRAGPLAILPKDKDTGCAQPDERAEQASDQDVKGIVFSYVDLCIADDGSPDPKPGPFFSVHRPDGEIPEGGETKVIGGVVAGHGI